MKTKLLIAFVMSAALCACGGKAKKSTTPENKGGTQTEMNANGSAMGGSTYGGTMTPAGGTPTTAAAPIPARWGSNHFSFAAWQAPAARTKPERGLEK